MILPALPGAVAARVEGALLELAIGRDPAAPKATPKAPAIKPMTILPWIRNFAFVKSSTSI
jgi:hypothetical protein